MSSNHQVFWIKIKLTYGNGQKNSFLDWNGFHNYASTLTQVKLLWDFPYINRKCCLFHLMIPDFTAKPKIWSNYRNILKSRKKNDNRGTWSFNLTPYQSVVDFWKINFEKSSLMNWIFSLFRTGFLLPV